MAAKGPRNKGSGSKQQLMQSQLALEKPCLTEIGQLPLNLSGMHLTKAETFDYVSFTVTRPILCTSKDKSDACFPGLCMLNLQRANVLEL